VLGSSMLEWDDSDDDDESDCSGEKGLYCD
jgi:hypothetical protein